MWTYVASCDRLACESYAEVKEEFDLPTGWYEVSVGLEKDRLGTGVSDTIGVFCTLEHAIETLQMRSTGSLEHDLPPSMLEPVEFDDTMEPG